MNYGLYGKPFYGKPFYGKPFYGKGLFGKPIGLLAGAYPRVIAPWGI